MRILLSNKEIIEKINNYSNPNWIWIEIWEISRYEIQVVVTVNQEEMCHLANHIVIHAGSAQTDEANNVTELKAYGKSLTRLIRRKFPDSEVHSKLYYK